MEHQQADTSGQRWPSDDPVRPAGTSGRPPTHPRETLEAIRNLRLRGHTPREVAQALGMSAATVANIWVQRILPEIRRENATLLEMELAKIGRLEAVAWEQFEQSGKPKKNLMVRRKAKEGGVELAVIEKCCNWIHRHVKDPTWLNVVEWCIEMRCRLAGLFAPTKMKLELQGDFRVAGLPPESVDQTMLERLRAGIEERRRLGVPAEN